MNKFFVGVSKIILMYQFVDVQGKLAFVFPRSSEEVNRCERAFDKIELLLKLKISIQPLRLVSFLMCIQMYRDH